MKSESLWPPCVKYHRVELHCIIIDMKAYYCFIVINWLVIIMLFYCCCIQAVPGPGKYEIRGQFDPSPPKVNTEGIEVEHPPFGTQAKVCCS